MIFDITEQCSLIESVDLFQIGESDSTKLGSYIVCLFVCVLVNSILVGGLCNVNAHRKKIFC